MIAASLFSGGKDSLYATYLVEKQSIKVNYLISIIPSFPIPSPHIENIKALKLIAESMNKKFITVDLHKGEYELTKVIKSLNVDALVGGDVFVEEHISWLKDICDKANVQLLEPLYGMKTLEIFHEVFKHGFKAVIIGVDLKYLGEEWLGFTLSAETATNFLSKNKTIDPLGENGEYHTLVIDSPLYSKPFKIKHTQKKIERNTAYLKVALE